MNKPPILELIELRMSVVAHCAALRAVVDLLQAGNVAAATARLEGAVASLEATSRGQMAGVKMRCDACGRSSDVFQWMEQRCCPVCQSDENCPKDSTT